MEEQELAEVYRRYFPIIRAKASRMLRDPDEAQDVAQETFSRLWQKRDTLRDSEACLAWVYRTASRIAIDRIRKRNAKPTEALVIEPDSKMNETDAHESRAALAKLVSTMPERELEVLVLTRVDGLKQQEVGKLLELSDRTVRRVLESADGKLRRFRGQPKEGPT